MSGPPPRLRMLGMRRRFGATIALDGVDLDVAPGEVHAVVGENGAGKSTLMKVLSGAVAPDAGAMWLDGAAYAPRSPAEGRRAGVAMVYQELALAPHGSAIDNICLGAEPGWGWFVDRRAMRRAARAALAQLGHEGLPLERPVSSLAPAGRQVVEIARCVGAGCRVLVLDEPTSSLDRRDAERLFGLVRRLRQRGLAVLYISHVLEEVLEIADRFTVLRDGRRAGGGTVAGVRSDDLVAMMVGRRGTELYPRGARRAGDVVLEVEGLWGGARPRGASLRLRRGEVLGIAGLVGAGRTELLRAIFGLDPVRRGSVRVGSIERGVAEAHAGPPRRWRQGVGLVSEDRGGEGLAARLSVTDNLVLPRLRGLGPPGLVWPARAARSARRWVEALGIRCASVGQEVGALSGGNQQKVALARLLHAEADVWLLDEPTRGIDVASKAQIYRLIDGLARGQERRAPAAILIVSSFAPELLGVCDRIAVMSSRGRLGEARPAAELDEHAILREATGGAA